MEDNFYTNIIGKGITFPWYLTQNENGETGLYPVNGSFELIKHNISSLLYYMIGQRLRQENFGTRLWECIEEPNTQALSFLIKDFLGSALRTWEDRITIQDIEVARVDSKIRILITYVINGTNSSQYLAITYDYANNSLTQ